MTLSNSQMSPFMDDVSPFDYNFVFCFLFSIFWEVGGWEKQFHRKMLAESLTQAPYFRFQSF